MTSNAYVECRFLVPTLRNTTRELHSPTAWRLLQDALLARFQGSQGPRIRIFFSPSLHPGDWAPVANAPAVTDECREYLVAVESSRLDELRDLLGRAAVTFDQEVIYVSIAGTVDYIPKHPARSGLEDE